jgi:hypothetical protein
MNQGILKVTEMASKNIEATAVKLHIVIEGSHMLYGNAALEKSIEVQEFVKKLDPFKEAITTSIASIDIKSDSSWFAKSSKGIYNLSLTIHDLENINQIFGVIAEAKNLQLRTMEWLFEESAPKLELVKQAVAKAKYKAETMMSVINYKVVGIRTCSDSYESPTINPVTPEKSGKSVKSSHSLNIPAFMRESDSISNVDLGTRIISRKRITSISTIEFYIEPIVSEILNDTEM